MKKKIRVKLEGVDIRDVRDHLEDIFRPAEDISDLISGKDIRGIFSALKNNHLWKFNNINKLSNLAKEFIDDDQVMKEIDEYNNYLITHKMGTRICEQINLDTFKHEDEEDHEDVSGNHNPDQNDPSYYQPSYRKELRLVLFRSSERNVNLTDQSLKYLEEIWERLRKTFKISLESVLDAIKAGCIEVVWYIPSISAQQILDRLKGSEEFFQEIFASMIQLEGALVYSESVGVVSSQVMYQFIILTLLLFWL